MYNFITGKSELSDESIKLGEKEILRKAVQMIKYRDKVLDLVLRLESEEVENYAENRN